MYGRAVGSIQTRIEVRTHLKLSLQSRKVVSLRCSPRWSQAVLLQMQLLPLSIARCALVNIDCRSASSWKQRVLKKGRAWLGKWDCVTTVSRVVTWQWIAEVKWDAKWMAADGNITQCCMFRRRSTTVVALLSTHQPPRERLVRVLPVDLVRLEWVPSAGPGRLVSVVLLVLERTMCV